MKQVFRSTLVAATLLSLPMMAFAQDGAASGSGHGRFAKKFKAADTNGDHMLSKDEMQKGMPRLAEHFDEIDTNHDGQASPAEVKTFMQAKKAEKDKADE